MRSRQPPRPARCKHTLRDVILRRLQVRAGHLIRPLSKLPLYYCRPLRPDTQSGSKPLAPEGELEPFRALSGPELAGAYGPSPCTISGKRSRIGRRATLRWRVPINILLASRALGLRGSGSWRWPALRARPCAKAVGGVRPSGWTLACEACSAPCLRPPGRQRWGTSRSLLFLNKEHRDFNAEHLLRYLAIPVRPRKAFSRPLGIQKGRFWRRALWTRGCHTEGPFGHLLGKTLGWLLRLPRGPSPAPAGAK